MNKRERFKLSVSVFVILRKQNKILLIKRTNTGWMDGYYSVPAGALDGNETLLEAAKREVKEEVGVMTENGLSLVHTMHCFTHGEEWIGQFFMTESWKDNPEVKEPHKHSEVRWVETNHLPENIIPYVRQAIENVQNNIAYSSYKDN